jgi:hypothetical protein
MQLERHLKKGEYKEYVWHLAHIAGVFIAMGEEIGQVLLTQDEQDELRVAQTPDGLGGDLLILMQRDVDEAGRMENGDNDDRST